MACRRGRSASKSTIKKRSRTSCRVLFQGEAYFHSISREEADMYRMTGEYYYMSVQHLNWSGRMVQSEETFFGNQERW